MHENREISSAPWCNGQGRSAKAINHNADMHVLEKSDHVVVPVNRRTREGGHQQKPFLAGLHQRLSEPINGAVR
jgi:hypothetical protein